MRVSRYWSPAGGPASRAENAESRVAHLADDLNPLANAPESGREAESASGARFTRTLLETDLFDAVDRLGYRDSPAMRFAAVARLRDLAFYAEADGTLPLFSRVSHHLAAGLRFDESPEMRQRIAGALQEIAGGLAANGSAEHAQILVKDLADANRSALRAFLEALGLFYARRPRVEAEGDSDAVRFLAEITEFAPDDSGLHCVLDLSDDPACIQAARFAAFARSDEASHRVQATTRSDEGVEEVWSEGERLKASVAPLVAALHAAARVGTTVAAPGVFLAGADLSSLDLRGADLSRAYLEGATLAKADITGADLRGVCFSGAALGGVVALDRNEPDTLGDFTEADWWNAAPDSWFGEAGASLRQLLLRRFPPPASLRGGGASTSAATPGITDRVTGKAGGRNTPRRTARTLFESGPAGETPGLLRDSTSR